MMSQKIKSLIINDVLYAEYIIENDTIFLKMLRMVIPDNARVSENMLISIVQDVENTKFQRASFLNN